MDFPAPLLPQDSDPLDISIPYVGSYGLVEGPFDTLPLRHGFTMHDVNNKSQLELDQEHSYAEYTALLQTWLFFGLIHAIGVELELPIELSEFVQHPVGEGRATVTAKPLAAWNAIVPNTEPDIVTDILADTLGRMLNSRSYRTLMRRRHRDRGALSDQAKIAFYNATVFDFINPQDTGESDDRALTILSIKFLSHYVNLRTGDGDTVFSPYCYNKPLSLTKFMVADTNETIAPSAKILKRYLQDRGWCPVYAGDLLARNNSQSVYLAAAVVPQIGTPSMHEECSVQKGCLAWNVKLDEIQQKHTKQNCCCTIVKPNMSRVHELLEQGQIPVIEVGVDPRGKFLLEIKSSDTDVGYTAISHIWADGLACGKENGLLECQLRRIRDLVLDLEAEFVTKTLTRSSCPPLFYRAWPWLKRLRHRVKSRKVSVWMDALCIPIHDPHQPDKTAILKKRAISLMTPTYAGAKNVLVLDHCLEQIGSNTNYRALSSLIAHSRWMQRCWTLQEGALAQRLFFQCCGWIHAPQSRTREEEEYARSVHAQWDEEITLRDVDDDYNTQSLIESLLSRSTSMPSDIDAIFASLSLLDASEIMDYPKDHRAKAFFRSQVSRGGGYIPLNLLLRRLNDIPQRARSEWWVPDLNSRTSFFCDGTFRPGATLYDHGLVIRCLEGRDQYRFKGLESRRVPEGSVSSQKFWLNYTDSVSFWVELDLPPEQISTPEFTVARSARTLIFPSEAHLLLPRNSRGFIDRGLCVTHTASIQEMPSTSQSVNGANEVWPVQYDCAFSFGLCTPSSSIEFADCSSIRSLDVSRERLENAYLVQTDVTDWPDVRSVRMTKKNLEEGQDYHFYIRAALFILVFVIQGSMVISFALGLITVGRDLGITLILVALIPLWGYPSLQLHIRRRRFRQWARSFALKEITV